MSEVAQGQSPDLRQRLGKAAMVPLWSSGFIVATLATRHAPGLTLLFWRVLVGAALMAAITFAFRPRWPRDPSVWRHMIVVGLLLQAAQFAGIFLALEHGVPAGVTALLAGSSPLIVAVIAAAVLDEHLRRAQWIGSVIGVTGVLLAVIEEVHGGGTPIGFVFALLGLAGLVGGTLVQRAHGAEVDARVANTIQLVVATIVLAPLAAVTDGVGIPSEALLPLVWLTVGLSIGAVLLFFWILRREKSGEATSFLYLVPATTAVVSVPVLGQPLELGAVIGLGLALIGVRLVSSPTEPEPVRRARRRVGRLVFGSAN
jgi:drug/metabolite transporter (DMT)-like permease